MTETVTLSKFATASEIAGLFNLSRSSVHKLSKNGEFPKPLKIGRCLRWNIQAVKQWINTQQQENLNNEIQ